MLPLVALALLWANTGLMYAGNLRGTAGSTDLLLAVSTALIVTGGYFWYRTRNDVDLV
jgi:G:T-mismatch repair DNA endonuclease (very short patch repair protein)